MLSFIGSAGSRTACGPQPAAMLARRDVGVSPKAVLARYRLQDAAAAIGAGEVTDLAVLATMLDWYDQAHFSRDYRAVLGLPPSAYLQQATKAPAS